MLEKIGDTELFHINRGEANFDRACDEAWKRALMIARIDEDGYSPIKGWERSKCNIELRFVDFVRFGGTTCTYTFSVTAKLNEE